MGYGGPVVTPPIVPPLADDGGRTDVLPLVVNRDRRRWLEGGVASGICCAGELYERKKGTKSKRRKWMKIENRRRRKKERKKKQKKREEESSIKVSSLCLLFLPDYFVHVARAGAAALLGPVGGRKNKGRFKTS
jgi:hypothetical protein